MVTLRKHSKFFVLFCITLMYAAYCQSEQSDMWSRAKIACRHSISHPKETAKTVAKVCIKSAGVALAAGVLGYYGIRGLHAIVGKFKGSIVGYRIQTFAKPIKKVVILASLALLGYECGHSLLADINQIQEKPRTAG